MKRIKIIAPSHLKKETIDLYKEINDDLFGLDFKSINLFIRELEIDNCSFETFKVEAAKLNLVNYREAINNKSFYSKLYSLKKELTQYNVDLNKTTINSELKELLNLLDFSYDYSKLDNDYSNTYILDIPYSIFEEEVLNKIIDKGAKKILKFKEASNHKYLSSNRTLRDNYDSIMQDIINKDYELNDIAFVATDKNNINLLKSSLDLYNIPANYLFNCTDSKVVESIKVLIDLYDFKDDIKESYISFKKLIRNNILCKCSNRTIKYVENEYYLNYSSKNYLKPERLFNKESETYYYLLEEDYFKDTKDLTAKLNKLVNIDNLADAFIYIVKTLDDNSLAIRQIRNLLLDYEKEDINIDSILDILNRVNNLPVYKQAITITDLNHPVYNKKVIYVLDATINNYPPKPKISSLIRLDDLKDTNYPTQSKFIENINKRLSFINSSELTYYTYPYLNNDGKQNEISLYLSCVKDKVNLELVDLKKFILPDYEIKDDYSKEFIKDNEFKEKVTQIENYFKCNFKFLLSKLKNNYDNQTNITNEIKDKNKDSIKREIELNRATTGNIAHKVMETLINNNKQSYYDYTLDDLNPIIDDQINTLIKYLPSEKATLEAIAYNLKDSFMHKQELLKWISSDGYVPYKVEEKVSNREYIFNEGKDINTKVVINGIIDRIDVNEEGKQFRIIDYKTGPSQINELSLANIKKGEKLQLLIYSVIYYQLLKEKGIDYIPSYASYINLKNCSIKLSEHYLNSDKYIDNILENEDIPLVYQESNKLRSIALNDDLKDCEYTQTFNGCSYEALKEILDDVFINLINSIKENKFNDTVVKNHVSSCEYCDFKDICPAKLYKRENKEEE